MLTGIVFPGQGSQYVGMGKSLIEAYPTARRTFEEADERLGFHLTKLCLEGPEEQLRLTYHTQPALLTASIAFYRVLTERVELNPIVAAGHSLGEYSALVAAGAMAFGDAVHLVHRRGQLMDEAVPAGQGAMAAVLGLDEEPLTSVCAQVMEQTGEVVELANLNCPGQIVISGTAAGVQAAATLAKEQGAKRVIPLTVSGPFHCRLMRAAADSFGALLDATVIQDASIPVVANVDAVANKDASQIREALKRQLYSPVRWTDDVQAMRRMGVERIVEIGPGTVLSGLIRKIDRGISTAHVEDEATLAEVIELFSN
ncbi:malonyl CoA-acyl carrier protein transacylase [Alicyclobacillus acidoterrestris]|uniref:ACP S-malonyltransferase n=1 Tax=Alicyclobacillus suci TaxID=2816080 RepID=UPI0011902B64|nr:ACP S-malonyltransferase [Alicyclobacillus suci]GEO25155.1 malonyl CoA-acyl carrier protein transacylase [Alicyclobacillus acidoterrestris]